MKIAVASVMSLVLTGSLVLCAGCGKSGSMVKTRKNFSDVELRRYSEAKEKALARVLGPMHNLVGHAIIPFELGAAVDMYYFPERVLPLH
jgi:hypothetical protein